MQQILLTGLGLSVGLCNVRLRRGCWAASLGHGVVWWMLAMRAKEEEWRSCRIKWPVQRSGSANVPRWEVNTQRWIGQDVLRPPNSE